MENKCPFHLAASLAESGCPTFTIEEILATSLGLGFEEAKTLAQDAAFARLGKYTGWAPTS